MQTKGETTPDQHHEEDPADPQEQQTDPGDRQTPSLLGAAGPVDLLLALVSEYQRKDQDERKTNQYLFE